MRDIKEVLEERNRKIIRAVIEKARSVCPGALALVGINGSFATGQYHPRSDLDLLIVINDDTGYRLAAAFVEEDLQAAHDIYCLTWDRLRNMALCETPHVAKLLDSKIVYSAGREYDDALNAIRAEAEERLRAPFGEEALAAAERYLKEAEHCWAMMLTAETLSELRLWSADLICFAEDALAMLNRQYYRLGVRARYEELSALKNRPDELCSLIETIAAADTENTVRQASAELMKALSAAFRNARESLAAPKKAPGPGDLEGTYEEMYSNFRGKMHLAAETNDRHLALMTLNSFRYMLTEEIGGTYGIGDFDVMAVYDPADLKKTEAGFDTLLFRYRAFCESVGTRIRRYENADAFIREYLGAEEN